MLRLTCCLLLLLVSTARGEESHSAYDKMTRANEIAQTGRDLRQAVALAKEALPEVSTDPRAVAMYCQVLIDARSLPGIDAQLGDCIAHLYVLDPEGMKANYLGAVVSALHGNRDLARRRLDAAKKAGLPDAAYTQLAAQLGGQPAVVDAPSSSRSMGKMIVAFGAGAVGTAALVLVGVWLSRRRRALS